MSMTASSRFWTKAGRSGCCGRSRKAVREARETIPLTLKLTLPEASPVFFDRSITSSQSPTGEGRLSDSMREHPLPDDTAAAEFSFAYQPIVDAGQRSVIAYEALI